MSLIRSRLLPAVLGGVLVLGPALPAWSARPLETEDTEVLAPGVVELELSADLGRQKGTTATGGIISIHFGLLPRVEINLDLIGGVVDPPGAIAQGGLADSVFAAKFRFLDETEQRPGVILYIPVRLPTGDEDRGLGESGITVVPLLGLGKSLGPVTFNWNGGYGFVTADRREDFVALRGSVEYRPVEPLHLVAEMIGRIARRGRARDEIMVRTGLAYDLGPRVTLDGAVAFGLTRHAPDVLVTLGLTLNLVRPGR